MIRESTMLRARALVRGHLWRPLLLLALVPLSETALPQSSILSSRIASIAVNRSMQLAFLKMETTPGNKPSCAIHYWDYTFPLTTESDRALYASLLAAFHAGNSVAVYGTGVCTEYPQAESLGSGQTLAL
jgi:hypothetical protein